MFATPWALNTASLPSVEYPAAGISTENVMEPWNPNSPADQVQKNLDWMQDLHAAKRDALTEVLLAVDDDDVDVVKVLRNFQAREAAIVEFLNKRTPSDFLHE
jgi:hypothetical protein